MQVQATDALGATVENTASTYTYLGLANYTPVTPFRILDTRNTGGPIGQGLVRVPADHREASFPIPPTAAVLNVTEVSGSASSLLTVYPFRHHQTDRLESELPGSHRDRQPGDGDAGRQCRAGLDQHLQRTWQRECPRRCRGVLHAPGRERASRDSSIRSRPVRVCDTRTSCEGHVAVGAGRSIVVTVASAGGIPSDGTAEAAVVNLTGVAGSASTYLSLFPTDLNGHCNPTGTSTINLLPGVVRANRAMVELGPTTHGGAGRRAVRVQRRRHDQCARRRQRVVWELDGDGKPHRLSVPGTRTDPDL